MIAIIIFILINLPKYLLNKNLLVFLWAVNNYSTLHGMRKYEKRLVRKSLLKKNIIYRLFHFKYGLRYVLTYKYLILTYLKKLAVSLNGCDP